MCGRFTLTVEHVDLLVQSLGLQPTPELEERYIPRWNIAPMQEHWIVVPEREERVALPATWGLVNWWEDSRRAGAKHINARAESLTSARPFREAFKETRCLIPADGFFEWTGPRQARRPFWYHRPEGDLFYFAGLYTTARLKGEDGRTTTFTIVTTRPNELVARVHDRMPAILPDEDAIAAWLDPQAEASRLKAVLRPVAERFLVARPVSPRVNSVANDGPTCLLEEDGDEGGSQPPLFAPT